MPNECTECDHCKEKAKKLKIEKLWAGAKIERRGEVYLVAQVAAAQFHLIGVQNGNRWSDPARDIHALVALANKDGFQLKKGIDE